MVVKPKQADKKEGGFGGNSAFSLRDQTVDSPATARILGGEGGIRTRGVISNTLAFQASALVHYATSPYVFIFILEHKNMDFISILLAFAVILFVAFIVTFFWKISFHAIMITSLFISSIILGNIYLEVFLFLMIFTVSYSRYVLKKHTIGQLIAGVSLVSLVFIILFLIVLK